MFSVIIPLYNKACYIKRAINSVLNQSFKEIEIIVINDGSTDSGGNTVSKEYGEKVKLIAQANQGVSKARNKGIAVSKYNYIAFLDADDYWHPQYLEFVAKVVSENPQVGIIGCHYDPIKLEESPVHDYFRLENYFKEAVHNTRFFTSATCIKKEFFTYQPGFDPTLKHGEDIDVWLRASLYFGDGIYINNTLVYYGQEDAKQATKKTYHLDHTFIPKILSPDYYANAKKNSNCSIKTFQEFQSKWIYINLIPHYALESNHPLIKKVLSYLPIKYSLIHYIYKVPASRLKELFAFQTIRKGFRNYLKFCYRFIYT